MRLCSPVTLVAMFISLLRCEEHLGVTASRVQDYNFAVRAISLLRCEERLEVRYFFAPSIIKKWKFRACRQAVKLDCREGKIEIGRIPPRQVTHAAPRSCRRILLQINAFFLRNGLGEADRIRLAISDVLSGLPATMSRKSRQPAAFQAANRPHSTKIRRV